MADEAAQEETITLRSKDGKVFTVSVAAANLSELVNDSMTDDDNDMEGPVDVLRVHSETLEQVVKFLTHFQEEPMTEIPTPLNGTSFTEIVQQEWYKVFLQDVDREHVFDLLTAANYMGIKPLLDLTCLKVTFELTGKSADEIRTILNLPELSPEEEAKARQEHRWIFEDN